MNYMEQVAKILGVELNEEFYIEDSDYKYKITKDGMKVYYGINDDWNSVNYTLGDILSGKREIKKPILDEKEKEYLSAVIKPFRDRVEGIVKYVPYKTEYIRIKFRDIGGNRGYTSLPSFEKDTMYKDMECIKIKLHGIDGYVKYIFFPPFKKGTMYKDMELNKEYSLEDLNL